MREGVSARTALGILSPSLAKWCILEAGYQIEWDGNSGGISLVDQQLYTWA